ncbi:MULTISPECIES: DUF3243 domain-containing protein [Bacillaceae]|uniref:DUF3243 domain-containing protein n=1 Tax=Bacillus mesophilum TaxID=1071718 RepID=A0A7V7RS37_9BACI|nr:MULTISPECIES: DUF3243 domain-containing protein [Bacillaceae]KAB2335767.1 DUF3243 domain-containing protein [Bacillus mesophilum]
MNHDYNTTNGQADKVNEKLQDLSSEQTAEILENFEEFKSYLGKKVAKGEKLGLNEEQLANAAKVAAEYLAKNESPRNREEKLLQELWKTGTEEEKHMLSHMLVKLVK